MDKSPKNQLIKMYPICKEIFKTHRHHGGNKTCSKKCASQLHSLNRGNAWKKAWVYCSYCGAFLLKPRCRVDGRNHFCNHDCKSAHQCKDGTIITLVCQTCGDEYQTTKGQVEHRGSRYCSRECQAAAKSLQMRGPANPNYKGGGSSDYGPNWGSQKCKVRNRDGHRCRSCNVGRRGLDVHHIKPIRDFDGDWESANQFDNLITLCRSCHLKVEYGSLCLLRPSPLQKAPTVDFA